MSLSTFITLINCLNFSRRPSASHTALQSLPDHSSSSSGHHRSGHRHRHPDSLMQEEISSGFEKSHLSHRPEQPESSQMSKHSSSHGTTSQKEAVDPGAKKEKIKNLWGKVGRHGMLQAAADKKTSLPPMAKWDQVLNPLLQSQKQTKDTKTSTYLNTTVGGEVGSGSGFYGLPGNTTMECDCGDDSCSQCNLMLNMGTGY